MFAAAITAIQRAWNDLSRSSRVGTLPVPDLCQLRKGFYTEPTWLRKCDLAARSAVRDAASRHGGVSPMTSTIG